MCYVLTISTTSDEDLRLRSNTHYQIEPVGSDPEAALSLHLHENRWCITGPFGGCSCSFRHLAEGSTAFDFASPENWMEEDPEDLEATKSVYDMLTGILASGHQLDLIDVWNDTSAA